MTDMNKPICECPSTIRTKSAWRIAALHESILATRSERMKEVEEALTELEQYLVVTEGT